MIKLLIVDDEPLVQIGIKSMLNWADYDIEICGTAMNGKDALEIIKEFSPEIVISDIKMPIMNGLELAKTCKEIYGPLPLFLILTSYEEFQLVKEALSYQVVDYLIKLELDPSSLAEAIGRAKKRLEEHQASESYKTANRRPLLQSFHDKFFMRLLHNLFESENQFYIQAKDLRLDFSYQCCLAAQCEIHESETTVMDDSKLYSLYSSTLQMTKEILVKHLPCHVISLDIKHFAVIFYFPAMEDFDNALVVEALENAMDMVHNYFNVWLSIGLGTPAASPLHISDSYQEARQASALCCKETPLVFSRQVSQDSFRNSFNIAVFRESITKAFDEFDTDVLYDILTEIGELFISNPSKYLQAMDAACSILYLAFSLLPEGASTVSEIFSTYPNGYRSIYRSKNVSQVVEWLFVLRDGCCEILKSKRKTYKDHVITNVQKYIDSHIEEHLSLNEVAAVFGLSPNYLSVLFKKTCNIGFSEYITQKKISRAKALLLEQNLKVYEAAEHLGFESAFYFSKVFKKVEGVSPREFIQQKLNISSSDIE